LPSEQDVIDVVLAVINRLNVKLSELSSAEDSFSAIAAELKSIAGSDYAAILLIDPESDNLTIAGLAGAPIANVHKFPPIKMDIDFRRRLSEKKTASTMRADSPEIFPPGGRSLAEALNLGSMIVCSILMREQLVGYLAVAKKKGSAPFPTETEHVMTAVANYFAVAIENVRASSNLRRAKVESETIFDMAPIGIFTCDSKGIFQSVNKQMLKLLGKDKADQILGTSAFEDQVIMKCGLDRLIVQGMEGHDGERIDVHVVPMPDKAFYLHARVTPIRSELGEVQRVLFVGMDVTSKVRLQNQLERSYEKMTQTYQELERVTKMKSQFIDVVSHELRTPLTVMRGYIDLVESEYSAKLDKKFASKLSIIKTNTDRLYTLVESMLDVSRLEKGSLQIHPEPVRVDMLLQDIVNARTKDAQDKRQSLTLGIEGSIPLIMADRRRLKDVFNNLLDNAIKYTQDEGRIQVGARDEGRLLHLWVKDNGSGIPLENLGKLFETFHIITSDDLSHQVDRLGLGLPISKGIIEAHNGRIWVESQVGKGSVFHVELPKEEPKPPP